MIVSNLYQHSVVLGTKEANDDQQPGDQEDKAYPHSIGAMSISPVRFRKSL